MKKTGFLSFGHYRDVPGARVPTAGHALRDTIELAVAAEEAGLDGAWVRVHHFDQSLAAPFPLLAAMAARTERIDLGTGVIDLRYENPLYMAGEAAAADLISGGRLQLGISRGSPEPAVDGQEAHGYILGEGESWSDEARRRADRFRRAIAGEPMARSHRAEAAGAGPDLVVRPQAPGLADRIWWGAGGTPSARWAGDEGMNLVSSTLLLEEDGRPFHVQQADQIRAYRSHRAAAGHGGGMAAVTRSVLPVTDDTDRRYFTHHGSADDQVGFLDGVVARSGPTMVGEVDDLVRRLAADEAVAEADYVLFTLPNTLGVEHNMHVLRNLAAVARESGWMRADRMVAA